MPRPSETEILRFTKEIVVAHVSRNALDSESLLDLIRNVYTTLSEARGPLSAQANGAELGRADQTGAAVGADGPADIGSSGGLPQVAPGIGGNMTGPQAAEAPPTTGGPSPTSPLRAIPVPAVPVEDSVTPDYIVCLEDGRRFKTMKRWLKATYGMTPEQYREKWNLPQDYPVTAPNYAKAKSADAKRQGLGAGRPGRSSRPARPSRQRSVRHAEKHKNR